MTNIKVEGSKEELLKKAHDLAKKYEQECTGCAQTVMAGIFDTLNIWNDKVFKAASGLADGIGLTGNATCGALNGGAIVIGYLYGREREDFSDMLKPMRSYMLAKKLHDRFVEKYESPRCHDIQMKLMGRTYDLYDPEEFEEAMEEGMLGECSEVVGNTARSAVEIILEEEGI